ncbi:MAG: hypothetical protein AUJ55_07520 [Proteobacteria bacterium CG1_02_64_396]|nr:MAG: hypothetical protein AUJ55_07520 [Proteobacteria bacterium CG1_02_64_396]
MWLRSLMALVLMLVLVQPAHARPPAGEVIEAQGEVVRVERGGSEPITVGTNVFVGDRIKTGDQSRAIVRLRDGSQLQIGNRSELEIQRFRVQTSERESIFSLISGKVRAVVAKFQGNDRWEVRTPTLVAGVRGTDFVAVSDKNVGMIFTDEGNVAAGSPPAKETSMALGPNGYPLAPPADYSSEVHSTAGKMTESTTGHPPIAATDIADDPLLAAAHKALRASTDPTIPADWKALERLPAMLARWNLNYAHLLMERSVWRDAETTIACAMALDPDAEVQGEGWLLRGGIHARGTRDLTKAEQAYRHILTEFPQTQALEPGLFNLGMLYQDQGRTDEARGVFNDYLTRFPSGPHAKSVRFFLGQ